jgi:hypothetical protein
MMDIPQVVEMPGDSAMTKALRDYFWRRREALIIELREIDRMLGRPQTIPPHKER